MTRMNQKNLLTTLLVFIILMGTSFGCENEKTISPKPPTAKTQPIPHRGVNHAHIHRQNRGYGSETSAKELTYLKTIGINAIAVTPFGYQRSATSDTIINASSQNQNGRLRDPTLSHQNIANEIENARQLGLKVVLKPHIWSRAFHDGNEWHGTIRQNSQQEHDKWWNDYQDLAIYFAKLAQNTQCEIYCIGTELAMMTMQYPQEWRNLIKTIKTIYHGKLTYAAHWDQEYQAIEFWDQLDYIGITAYFPLHAPDNANIKQLTTAWQPHIPPMETIQAKFQKPILFLEAGYRPVTGHYKTPWTYDGGTPDQNAQSNAYQALFEVFSPKPWWHGIYIWKTFTDPNRYGRRPSRNDFKFRDTPSEKIIQHWFQTQKNSLTD